ncbi:alpha-1,2 mannosyltransferase KTR1 [Coprinopsis cinerea AmutBmut pab1-1]|nr:alpha-1,2 mannosyltransferase KTR1 [Coprinopsis cinerea AmutBmut pab1-1]
MALKSVTSLSRGARPALLLVTLALLWLSLRNFDPESFRALLVPHPKLYSTQCENVQAPNQNHFGPVDTAPARRANATFVILARNSDLAGTVNSIKEIEDRFNRRYQYPYVFLNDEPFDEKFKSFLPVPEWIDEGVAKSWREWMVAGDIIYGGAYRNMCRFNSGFFFRHPLMEKYRWYWRIEPDVHFHCDINFDPFVFMEEHKKVYGFTITMFEYEATIMSLWDNVREFANMYPEYIAPDNSLEFISDDGGETYNLCHFWSNFEIADLDFWRAPAYQAFFEFLDYKGGFYYERWGDAPVHSIAAALFANRSQLHFFDEIGYEHPPYTHCPKRGNNWAKGRCTCDPEENFDDFPGSCLSRWERFINGTLS